MKITKGLLGIYLHLIHLAVLGKSFNLILLLIKITASFQVGFGFSLVRLLCLFVSFFLVC